MVQPSWQDALNPHLTQRLLRPLVCPGVIPNTLAIAIFERSRRFKQRLSLLHQFQQRWGRQSTLQVPDIPIVYAQWVSPTDPATTSPSSPDVSHPVNHPSTWVDPYPSPSTAPFPPLPTHKSGSSAAPLVIQAKFASSASPSSLAESALPVVKSPMFSKASDTLDRNRLKSSLASNTIISTTSIFQFSNTTPAPSAVPVTEMLATEPGLPIVTPATLIVTSEYQTDLQSSLPTPSSALSSQDLAMPARKRSASSSTKSEIAGQRAISTSASPSVSSSLQLTEQPLVMAQRITPVSVSAQSARFTQPLVFARSMPASSSPLTSDLLLPPSLHHPPSAGVPVAQAQVSAQPQSIPPSSTPATSPINLNRLTQQVERNLARKLTIERERRGQRTWR